jgi:hypothetical protein
MRLLCVPSTEQQQSLDHKVMVQPPAALRSVCHSANLFRCRACSAVGVLQLLVQPNSSSSSKPVQLTVQQQQQSNQAGVAAGGAAAAAFAGMAGVGSSSSVASNVRVIQQSNLAQEPALQLMLAQAATSHQVSAWHDVWFYLPDIMEATWTRV